MRQLLSVFVAAPALAGIACATTLSVSSHVDRARDFRLQPYDTYDWGPPDALPSGDARLDSNPLHSSPTTSTPSLSPKVPSHMLGQAIDIRLGDVPLAQLHRVALGTRGGGVWYYPASNFVHVYIGQVRTW